MVQGFALVTGARGFIGSHMVDYLIEKGYRVRATDLSFAPKTYLNKKAEFVPADITEKEEIYPLLKDIEAVFHFGAIYNFAASMDVAFKVNVIGTENLLQACRSFPEIKRIIVPSTGAFYDSKGYNIPGMKFSERSPVRPKNIYEITKLEQEKAALEYAQKYNLPVTVIRLAGVYGTRSHYGIALIILYLGRGQLSFIPGKGNKPAAIVHVLDVVRAAEFLSRASEETIGEIYNVADDTTDSVADLIRFAAKQIPDAKVYGRVPSFIIDLMVKYSEWLSKRTGRPPKIERGIVDYILYPFLMSNRKIKALGFKLEYPEIKKGLKEVIEWYLPLFNEGQGESTIKFELTDKILGLRYQIQEKICRLGEFLRK